MKNLRNIVTILVIIVLLWGALHPARTKEILHHSYSVVLKHLPAVAKNILDRLGLQEKKKDSH